MFTSNNKSFEIEKLAINDVEDLIRLSQSVGWDYDQHELETIFHSGEIFGCRDNNQIIASAAIIPYDNKKLASIGMVIVHPNYRGFGFGKKVTKACIESMARKIPFMLIATEEGKPLYHKMGFKEVGNVWKYTCERCDPQPTELQDETIQLRVYEETDYNAIVQLDANAFGDKRSHFLLKRIKQAKKCFVIEAKDREIIGYGLSIQTPANVIIGPIVSTSPKGALLLIDQLLRSVRGPIRIDMPNYDQSLINYLLSKGFVETSKPAVMLLHADHLPARNGELYAVAAQIFG